MELNDKLNLAEIKPLPGYKPLWCVFTADKPLVTGL